MKPILILLISLLTFSGNAQTQYEKGMQKALDLWQENKPIEAVNLFERIAKAEPDNWLPPYYAAYVMIVQGFGIKDVADLKSHMDKAQLFLNEAKTRSQDNAQIIILDALWHTVWVAYDGQKYGMLYAGKVAQLYDKALQLDPDNPNVVFNKAQWDIGGAKFFGQPVEAFCKDIERAIELDKSFSPEELFYPKFDVKRAQQLLTETCSK